MSEFDFDARQVAGWNERNKPGTPCFVFLADGNLLETAVASPAWLDDRGAVMLRCHGIPGDLDLDRCHFGTRERAVERALILTGGLGLPKIRVAQGYTPEYLGAGSGI